MEVYGRDEGFDAQADPVVRLEARRLRRDLDGYYAGSGRDDPLRISIPKGGYQPRFDRTASAIPDLPLPAPEVAAAELPPSGGTPWRHPRRPAPLFAAAALLILAIAGLAVAFLPGEGPPREQGISVPVAILPFELIGANRDAGVLAAGLQQQLVVDLMRFPGLRLFSRAADPPHDPHPLAAARDRGIAYLVTGSLHSDGHRASVVMQLVETTGGQVRWSQVFDRDLPPADLVRLEKYLASEISAALGQPYGALSEDLRSRAADPHFSGLESYLCVLRAYDYRRNFDRAKFPAVLGCSDRPCIGTLIMPMHGPCLAGCNSTAGGSNMPMRQLQLNTRPRWRQLPKRCGWSRTTCWR